MLLTITINIKRKAIELINVESKIVSGLHTILARDKNNKTALGFKGYLFLNDSLKKKIIEFN